MTTDFNFFQHWYPISPLADLDPHRPQAVMLLGIPLVIWKSPNSDQYSVFLDECPHRLAPLSEGRVDPKTGDLMCSYHGWQFDPQGHCTRIPQAEDPNLTAKHPAQFCVTALPSQEHNDLLWVWPDRHSADQATNQPLPLSPLLDASQGFVWSSVVRDLEYDWQTLMENVADPCHVPFAHHGIQGNRDQAGPRPIQILHSAQDRIEANVSGGLPTKIIFEPPCHLEYTFEFGNQGKRGGLVAYCIPVAPGKSRLIAQFPRNFAITLHHLTPRWIDHVFNRNLVLDGDMILLRFQERRLQQHPSPSGWKTAFKLPTSADRLVIEFRKWFDQYCQGQLPWGHVPYPETPPISDRPALLDRYHQHTQICSSCRRTLTLIQRLQVGLVVAAAIAVAGVAVLPDPLRQKLGIPVLLLAGLELSLWAWLKYWLEPRFYFVDYVHADR